MENLKKIRTALTGSDLQEIHCEVASRLATDDTETSRVKSHTITEEALVEVEVFGLENAEDIVVERDDAQDLRFKGRLIGFNASFNTSQNYSYLYLWQTVGGKFICRKEDVAMRIGGHDSSKVMICETIDDVKEFIGQDRISKEFYDDVFGSNNF